jgi:UDP-N-acetylmuramate--alanine ligase
VVVSGETMQDIQLNVGGLHNIENMLVAITIGRLLNIDPAAIADAVKAYKGVKRRFEYILKEEGGPVMIDDYAHHPGELEALLKSIRGIFPERKITVLFQPHLFSRTRDFADGFASSLAIADETLLLPIYPARELPIPGVTSSIIADKMDRVLQLEKEQVMEWIATNHTDVFVTAGAGDIDAMVPFIREALLAVKTIKE